MLEVQKTDISKIYSFRKYGSRFLRRSYNEKTGVYVFERWAEDENGKEYLQCLEVVKGKPFTNPDGTKGFSYPGAEAFGTYGKCVDINCYTDRMVDYYVNNPDKWGAEDSHNFKTKLYAGQN